MICLGFRHFEHPQLKACSLHIWARTDSTIWRAQKSIHCYKRKPVNLREVLEKPDNFYCVPGPKEAVYFSSCLMLLSASFLWVSTRLSSLENWGWNWSWCMQTWAPKTDTTSAWWLWAQHLPSVNCIRQPQPEMRYICVPVCVGDDGYTAQGPLKYKMKGANWECDSTREWISKPTASTEASWHPLFIEFSLTHSAASFTCCF